MSFYYKQEFTSPEPIYAEVKDTLHSYFSSGAIEDFLFPKWTEHCLRRFRKSSLKIEEIVLNICDYQACLPEGFDSVREAWMCTTFNSDWIRNPTSVYYQTDCRISAVTDKCDPCFDTENCCVDTYKVTHKVTGAFQFSFKREFLLQPGNAHTRSKCGEGCRNIGASAPNTFDVVNNKIITNFSEGTVYLIYYSEATEEGEQLIPKNFWVEDFIRKFLIYKCFEQLSNVITDESFNQIQLKKQEADRIQNEAFILAETELKKETVWDKVRAIKKSYNSFNKYRLP